MLTEWAKRNCLQWSVVRTRRRKSRDDGKRHDSGAGIVGVSAMPTAGDEVELRHPLLCPFYFFLQKLTQVSSCEACFQSWWQLPAVSGMQKDGGTQSILRNFFHFRRYFRSCYHLFFPPLTPLWRHSCRQVLNRFWEGEEGDRTCLQVFCTGAELWHQCL